MVTTRPSRWGIVASTKLAIAAAACVVCGSGIAIAEENVAGRVQAHIDAGEFGPAFQQINQVQDPQLQTQLLQQVAQAQLDAGEYDSSLYSIRRMDAGEAQSRTGRQRTQQMNLSGGSMMQPQFTPLIMLLMRTLDAEWDQQQSGGGGMGGAMGGGGGMSMGAPEEGTMMPNMTGVKVDPNGLMRQLTKPELTGRLTEVGIQARNASLNQDMSKPSSLRWVSLNRLERAVAHQIEEGRSVVASMRHLAGLSKIQYVMVLPESNDILIGGPAEPWRYDQNGLAVGTSSGRPMLELDDLVTVLRTFSPQGRGNFGCLIVPRQEGLKAVHDFAAASNNSGPLAPGQVRKWTKQLGEKLGVQDIEVIGLPLDSRVTRVIVEADYRMKLIGIGKLSPIKAIPSFFDLLAQTKEQNLSSVDALRWWMTMKYDAINHSPDHEAFEISGPSVQCLSENEVITAQGERIGTNKAEKTNRLFAEKFTENYAQLAAADPVFADLRNIFDLSLVAALIRDEGLDARTNWDYGVFAPGGEYRTFSYAPPKTVMTVVNHRVYNGRDIVVQVAGGVRGDVRSVIGNRDIRATDKKLEAIETAAAAPKLPVGRWWWDAR